ncbi:MAG: OprO/OprP family phosphate-selective porin [Myxococcota bacterium]|nr:OprO/OprP family phosphate-selective porin [Myxococcota bacterium]
MLACVAPRALADKTFPMGQLVPAPLSASMEWGKGVRLRAGDFFLLQLSTRLQIQGHVTLPTEEAVRAGARPEVSAGVLVRRMRLVFSGHAFTPRLTYYVQLGLATRDMEPDLLVPLRDAYLTWQPLRDLGVRLGQMKVPFGLQRLVSSSALQMVDRSIVTTELSLDRDIGLYLLSEDFLGLGGRLMYQVGLFTGRGRNRGPAVDGILLVARVQLNPFGRFDHLSEADHERSPRPRLSVGASLARNHNTNRSRSTHGPVYASARFDYLSAGGDLHLKWRGLSLLTELMYRAAGEAAQTDGSGRTEYARSALGYFVQVGFLPPLPLEACLRWGELFPLAPTDPTLRHEREAGGSLSFYFHEHALKLQTDYFVFLSDDLRASRHQWRLQAQLVF